MVPDLAKLYHISGAAQTHERAYQGEELISDLLARQ